MSATLTDPSTVPAALGADPQPASHPQEESPLTRLSPEQIERLGQELDAIHEEVFADLGERDSRYIRAVIRAHRQLVLAQHFERLGRRDLMNEMQVDEQHGRRVGALGSHFVLFPNLLEHGLRHV